MRVKLEVCCADLDSLIAARRGGASRVELCTGLSEGGLTPSPGLISQAAALHFDEINVLIRSRNGDFLYDSGDMLVMMRDLQMARDAGATGIVWGGLMPDGKIDRENLSTIRTYSRGMNLTFHRAFDLCANPREALEDIIEAGCTSLLTSGLASSAMKGADMIREIREWSKGRIDIIAGSGINSSNCHAIVERTGVSTIHATARRPLESRMSYRRPGVSMGTPDSDEYSRLVTSAEEVRDIIASIS